MCRHLALYTFGLLFIASIAYAHVSDSVLSSSAVDSITEAKVKVDSVPVGSIVVWSVSKNPPDTGEWLECNGSTFDKDKYPDLYAVLGSDKTPDYRSQFLRGGTESQAGTTAEDTIKSHRVTIPLVNDGTVYAPQLSSAADTIISSRVSLVKTGTEEYVCGTTTENYDCNCTADRTESYACGTTKQSYSCNCTADKKETYVCGKYSPCPKYRCRQGATNCPPAGYCDKKCTRTIKGTCSTCTRNVTKYCSRTIAGTCETCTRNVDKYCTRDVYANQVTTDNNTRAMTMSQLNVMSSDSATSASGTSSASGLLQGEYVGGEETAPKHIYVRYYIKAM